jgi:hypothetical protein
MVDPSTNDFFFLEEKISGMPLVPGLIFEEDA